MRKVSMGLNQIITIADSWDCFVYAGVLYRVTETGIVPVRSVW